MRSEGVVMRAGSAGVVLLAWVMLGTLFGGSGCATGIGGDEAVCGNGEQEGSEACDDGNLTDEDGCSAACVVEWCGDGVIQIGLGEECDDENIVSGDGCSGTCLNESVECGNGEVEGTEECDDDNTTDGDGCSGICEIETPPDCGNGNLDGDEECDDGNTNNEDGCSAGCLVEECGDGVTQGGLNEECDDGNTADGDGCSALCIVETCGDGVRQTGLNEECDDGNTTAGDGCGTTCQLDTLILQPGPTDGKDAQTYSINPDTSYPDVPYSFAQAWTWSNAPGQRRSYFEFALPPGMMGCSVASATLYLYHNPLYDHEGLNGNTLETEIARVTQAWDEQLLTWNNQPPVDAASTITLPPPPAANSDAQVDITAIASYWFANPGSNYGIRFKLQVEDYYRQVIYTSSDYTTDPLRRPAVAITFSSCP